MKRKPTYHYRTKRHRRRRLYLKVLLITVFMVAIILVGILVDILINRPVDEESLSKSVSAVTGEEIVYKTITEPTYTIKLPSDWEEEDRKPNFVTWRARQEKEDNRYVTIYVDKIPSKEPVNRMVPVAASGQYLRVGNISAHCSSITPGGTFHIPDAIKLPKTVSKWEDVEFICDLPDPVNNVIGTSSEEGINTVSVTGPSGETHKYFFKFTDHNKQPKDDIFIKILDSFQAK